MNKQDQLRAILMDIREVRGISWRESKLYACELLVKSPVTMDKWLSSGVYAQDIPDNELKLLYLMWESEKLT